MLWLRWSALTSCFVKLSFSISQSSSWVGLEQCVNKGLKNPWFIAVLMAFLHSFIRTTWEIYNDLWKKLHLLLLGLAGLIEYYLLSSNWAPVKLLQDISESIPIVCWIIEALRKKHMMTKRPNTLENANVSSHPLV